MADVAVIWIPIAADFQIWMQRAELEVQVLLFQDQVMVNQVEVLAHVRLELMVRMVKQFMGLVGLVLLQLQVLVAIFGLLRTASMVHLVWMEQVAVVVVDRVDVTAAPIRMVLVVEVVDRVAQLRH
jgi:hypothetical protein